LTTVGFWPAVKTVALDGTCKALAFADTGGADFVAYFKNVGA
jgi:hypothetical protein